MRDDRDLAVRRRHRTGSLSLNIFAVAQMFAGPRAAGTWIGVQNALGNISRGSSDPS